MSQCGQQLSVIPIFSLLTHAFLCGFMGSFPLFLDPKSWGVGGIFGFFCFCFSFGGGWVFGFVCLPWFDFVLLGFWFVLMFYYL